MIRHARPRCSRRWPALLAACAALAACSVDTPPRPDPAAAVEQPSTRAEPRGALRSLPGLSAEPSPDERRRLIEAADAAQDEAPSATETLEVDGTDDPFVLDAQRAWTLALAGRVTGSARYRVAAARIVDAWVTTATHLAGSCPRSGACPTSLMVSRSAPGLVQAVDLLRADGAYDPAADDRFRRWLRAVILPAVSDRDNNWGDAGTYLLAVTGAELGDGELLGAAADRWRERIDLIGEDGQIPEEIRRGDASLMYSQEALDYKVATADVLARAGHPVWDYRGKGGGSLVAALALVADGIEHPDRWPGGEGDLRVPDPAGLWAVAVQQWDRPAFARLATAALEGDGDGHSAILWTGITHPSER